MYPLILQAYHLFVTTCSPELPKGRSYNIPVFLTNVMSVCMFCCLHATFLSYILNHDVQFILFSFFLNLNSTTLIKLSMFSYVFAASILHNCSLHGNAQYGYVPFRVVQFKILRNLIITLRSTA